MDDFAAGPLLRRARRRAGLSQRALAQRAGTSQSVVARIELGTTDPSTSTLTRLLAAAGFSLRCALLRNAPSEPACGGARPSAAGRGARRR